MSDQTPIPAEALDAVIADFFLFAEPAYEKFDPLVRARLERALRYVAPDLLAAGRAADPTSANVSLSLAQGRLSAVGEVADWLGAQRGRTDAGTVYADLAELKLRTALGEHRPDGPCACPVCGAARVAENGADRPPVERTAPAAMTCGGCNDTIWPTETVYEFADGWVRCAICQVKSRRTAGADQ